MRRKRLIVSPSQSPSSDTAEASPLITERLKGVHEENPVSESLAASEIGADEDEMALVPYTIPAQDPRGSFSGPAELIVERYIEENPAPDDFAPTPVVSAAHSPLRSSSAPDPEQIPAPSRRLPLKAAAQRARYITSEKMGEILNLCLVQRELKIEHLEKEIHRFEVERIDPSVLEEMKSQASADVVKIDSLQKRISSMELELQKTIEALKVSQELTSNLTNDNAKLLSELMGQLRPEELRPVLNARFLEGILMCRLIAVKLDPAFPIGFFDPRNLGVQSRSDLKEFPKIGESSTQPPSNPPNQL